MAYSTVAQVQSEFRKLDVGADTAITTDEVTEFIVEADALINAKVGLRYSTPIVEADSPNAFALVRMISRKLVAYRIKDILEVKAPSTDTTNQSVRGDLSRKDLMKILDDIANGKMLLDDATAGSTAQGITSYNYENSEESFFKKNTDQW